MWSFLKNKHDISIDTNLRAKFTSYAPVDKIIKFTPIEPSSNQYTMNGLVDIQGMSIEDLEVYYEGSFTLVAQTRLE